MFNKVSQCFDYGVRSGTKSILRFSWPWKHFFASKIVLRVIVCCLCGVGSCLVPVRRFPSSSRSIRFGDVSEANGRETLPHFRMDHVTRNASVARKNEALGLGKRRFHVFESPYPSCRRTVFFRASL